MQDRLADAERDLDRADDPAKRARIEDEITLLREQIAAQQRIVDDPEDAARRVEQSITRGLERERQPQKPVGGVPRSKFINPPPGTAPSYFQNRHVETKLIGDFLKDDTLRLMTVVGRAGNGKTAVVCRSLKALEKGQLPDEGGPLSVDGIVYLSAAGSRRVNFPNLFADLGKLLPEEAAEKLDALYKNPQARTEAQMQALLAAFPDGRVVVLLDNFEDVIDPQTRNIRDAEIDEALRALLSLPPHGVKAILTSRIAPRELAQVQPGRQMRLDLDEGLASPYAENILREMDRDGKVGLKAAPNAVLVEARERTRGNPRALEALFAILSADRETSLREILSGSEKLLPQNVAEVLVGEAFCRLDPVAQRVMEALAVYARPVTPAAVDYLLQPYLPGVDSAPVLNRLVNMQFVRKETGRYYLHPVDRAYALERLPRGTVLDRKAGGSLLFTQFALLDRGAKYFEQARLPRENWKTMEDVASQLAEFDLRYAGQDYDTAASVLLEIGFDYLFLWGHYRLLVESHERLQGKLTDPRLRQNSVGNLGSAYYRMGHIEKAIECYELALHGARETKDRGFEGAWLGNLGNCYADLGQTARAVDYFEQALRIVRELGDRRGEASALANLGLCYGDLGQTARAIEHYQQTLLIRRDVADRQGEAHGLCNLGNCYVTLGQTAQAMDCFHRSLGIACEIGYRLAECLDLINMSDVLVHQGESQTAIRLYNQAIQIADEMGNVQGQIEARSGLALAHLYSGDLTAARAAAEAARQYDFPGKYHFVLALLGLIALRQGERDAAEEAFQEAVNRADAMLVHSPQFYRALDAKGLALAALALCEKPEDLPAAVAAYREARAINKDPGTVASVLRLLDALAPADPASILAGARRAASGEEASRWTVV